MNKFIYAIVAIAVFLVFIIAMAPASLLTTVFADDLQRNVPGLKVGNASGRLWQGSIQLQYSRFPAVLVSWDAATLALLTGSIDSFVEIRGDGLLVELDATLSPDSGLLQNVRGTIDSEFINAVSVEYGLDLAGQFTISEVLIGFDQTWLTDLNGNVDWSGGIIHIETPEQFHSVKLPALTGQLALENREARLYISDQQSRLLTLVLKPDGWSRASISYRLLNIAGLPVPNGYQDTTGPAFVLEEKVF